MTDEELNSEVELLQDREVLRKVVEETGAGGRDWFHFMRLGEGPAARIERATRRLAKKVTVEPVKKTNLIAIRYKASDPESAERVLQSLAKAYVEKHTSVHRPAGESRFFEQQMNEARAELDRECRGGRVAGGSGPAGVVSADGACSWISGSRRRWDDGRVRRGLHRPSLPGRRGRPSVLERACLGVTASERQREAPGMRAGVLSAGIFGIGDRPRPTVEEEKLHERVPTHTAEWSEEAFARQQIRNLVRLVFSSSDQEVRHVAFSGVEVDADVSAVCRRVGETLASERAEDVLVVISGETDGRDEGTNRETHLRNRAKRLDRNLWRLTIPRMQRSEISAGALQRLMAEVRREFEYSVVADSVCGWMGRGSLAESADGMVLVLSALRTRRASARKLLDDLSHVRLLGTVLQDRDFPIPEGIYHRL